MEGSGLAPREAFKGVRWGSGPGGSVPARGTWEAVEETRGRDAGKEALAVIQVGTAGTRGGGGKCPGLRSLLETGY